MEKPALLTAIDEALLEHSPAKLEALASGDMLHDAATFTDQVGKLIVFYRGIRLMRSLAELDGGFMVRVKPTPPAAS